MDDFIQSVKAASSFQAVQDAAAALLALATPLHASSKLREGITVYIERAIELLPEEQQHAQESLQAVLSALNRLREALDKWTGSVRGCALGVHIRNPASCAAVAWPLNNST